MPALPGKKNRGKGRTMNRREFLAAWAAAGAAIAGARPAAGAEEDRAVFAIVDTHQHLWDLKKFRLPWIKEGSQLARSHLTEDYRKATADLGSFPSPDGKKDLVPGKIVQAVYMEVDVDPAQQDEEADHVLDLCRRADNPTAAAVISGRPASEAFGKYLDRFKGNAYVKGVRQVLHGPGTPAGYCLDPNFIRGIRLLGERGLSFDLCLRHAELPDGAKLIEACPGTRFILDHCGNPDVQARDRSRWEKDMAALARHENVVGKVSGILASARPYQWTADELAPFINHTLKVFGPDRVLFGGDWPVCTLQGTYKQWVEALVAITRGRPLAEQRKLFHDNAVHFYGLET